MEDQAFTVTLPSNSNMSMYPSNRGNNYTVRLGTPLNFTRQTLNDNTSWEVALASLQYTNRFYDVRDEALVRMAVVYPSTSWIIMQNTQPVDGITILSASRTAETLKVFDDDDARVLKQFVKSGGQGSDTTVVCFTKVSIPAGHYQHPSVVYTKVANDFNKLFNTPRFSHIQMSVQINGSDGTLMFKLNKNTCVLHMWIDKPFMINTLGLRAEVVDNEKARLPLYRIVSMQGVKTPRFDVVQTLYVYSDIIKEQHVGDTLAPLMEVVPVQGSPSQRVHYGLNALTYLPVSRTFIETIRIYICDEYGNPVTFPDDIENVVCRLRFRRTKRDTMLLI